MKALVGAFNQEKALVGAFSVIVHSVVEPMDRFTALITRDNYTPEQGVVVDGGEGDLLVLQQRPHTGHQPGPRSRHLLVQRAAAQPEHGNS